MYIAWTSAGSPLPAPTPSIQPAKQPLSAVLAEHLWHWCQSFLYILEKHTLAPPGKGYVPHNLGCVGAAHSRHNEFHQDDGILLSADHKDSAGKSRYHLFISTSLNSGVILSHTQHLLSALSLPVEGWEGSAGLCTRLGLPEESSEQKIVSILNGIIIPLYFYAAAPLIYKVIYYTYTKWLHLAGAVQRGYWGKSHLWLHWPAALRLNHEKVSCGWSLLPWQRKKGTLVTHSSLFQKERICDLRTVCLTQTRQWHCCNGSEQEWALKIPSIRVC